MLRCDSAALQVRATTPEPSTKNAPATAGGARYLDQLYPSARTAAKAMETATNNKPNRANPEGSDAAMSVVAWAIIAVVVFICRLSHPYANPATKTEAAIGVAP